MKLDDLLKQIGEFGPYQKRAFVVAALPSILVAAENLAVIFIFFFPDHRYCLCSIFFLMSIHMQKNCIAKVLMHSPFAHLSLWYKVGKVKL